MSWGSQCRTCTEGLGGTQTWRLLCLADLHCKNILVQEETHALKVIDAEKFMLGEGTFVSHGV